MNTKKQAKCHHCDTPIDPKDTFCCNGCETVYHLLQNSNLNHYYNLKDQSDAFDKAKPVTQSNSTFRYLDDLNVIKEYATDNGSRMQFALSGVHCVACIWLIEKLPELVTGVESTQYDMSTQLLSIQIKPKGSFAAAIKMIDQLGYKANLCDPDRDEHSHSDRKQHLLNIGIAAACGANIMIFSIAIYAGLSGELKQLFEILSAILFLPILMISSRPFFKSAYSALRVKRLSIDTPICIALSLAGSVSYINVIKGNGHIYFDSLAMFVFLILSVRFIFNSAFRSINTHKALASSIIPQEATRLNENHPETVPTITLKKGDTVLVHTGQSIPVDGISQSKGFIDSQLLTGESNPIEIKKGHRVLAGMKNIGSEIHITVDKAGKSTQLAKLIQRISSRRKPPIVELADKISHYFLMITISLSIGLFIWAYIHHNSMDNAINSAIALLVIACPCALSLATPLSYALSSQNAAQNGIAIQHPDALEKLTHITNIFIDKTGTLTKGNLNVVHTTPDTLSDDIAGLLFSLEKHSSHPIAIAIRDFIHETHTRIPQYSMMDLNEHLGKGISGSYKGDLYEVKGCPSTQSGIYSSVGLFKNNQYLATITLGDEIKEESKSIIEWLKKHNYTTTILSGDSDTCVKAIQNTLKIDHAFSRLTPEQKVEHIQKQPYSLMIGDGANDAQAMLAASTSIAVQGSFEASIKAADIYFTTPTLSHIETCIQLAKHNKKIVIINLIISILYNSLGIILVLSGLIHPLLAAVLMPISSLTVIAISWLNLHKFQQSKNI